MDQEELRIVALKTAQQKLHNELYDIEKLLVTSETIFNWLNEGLLPNQVNQAKVVTD